MNETCLRRDTLFDMARMKFRPRRVAVGLVVLLGSVLLVAQWLAPVARWRGLPQQDVLVDWHLSVWNWRHPSGLIHPPAGEAMFTGHLRWAGLFRYQVVVDKSERVGVASPHPALWLVMNSWNEASFYTVDGGPFEKSPYYTINHDAKKDTGDGFYNVN